MIQPVPKATIAKRRRRMQGLYVSGGFPDGTTTDPETPLNKRWTPAQEANHREHLAICGKLAPRFQDRPFSVQEFDKAYAKAIWEPCNWQGGNKSVADEDE